MIQTNLPLTADQAVPSTPAGDRELAELVERFYGAARRDAVLGPIFEAHVSDWEAHLAKMRDFWSAAIYRTGRYAGRPLVAHRRVAEIRPEHFPRWVELWERAVDEVVTSSAAAPLKLLASRMADTMSARLSLSSDADGGSGP